MGKSIKTKLSGLEYVGKDETVIVELGYYGNNTLALRITDEIGEAVSSPTVNLESEGETPKEGHVFVKDYSENEGIYRALAGAGILGEAVRTVAFGVYDATAIEAPIIHPDLIPD